MRLRVGLGNSLRFEQSTDTTEVKQTVKASLTYSEEPSNMYEPNTRDLKAPSLTYDALILAGGKGTRLDGRDKGWIMYNGLPLIEHTLARLAAQAPQPARIMISANRNIDAYKQTGHIVVTDERFNFAGPLAGLEAGLMRCKKNNLFVVPCDTPFLPVSLFDRLQLALSEGDHTLAAYATTDDGPQPLCCLIHPSLAGSLAKYLDGGNASAIKWLEQVGAQAVYFSDTNAFSNFNTLDMFQTPTGKGQP